MKCSNKNKQLVLKSLDQALVDLETLILLAEKGDYQKEGPILFNRIEKRFRLVNSLVLTNHLSACIPQLLNTRRLKIGLSEILILYKKASKYDISIVPAYLPHIN